MKVREILDVIQVPEEELLTKLENVGIVADLETDITTDIIKKLSKVYKMDIRSAARKQAAAKEQPVPEKKKETIPKEEVTSTKGKEPDKPKPKAKKPVKPKPKKPEAAKTTPPVKPVKEKTQPSKTKKPDIPGQPEEPEIEFTRVYDDKYNDYEKETRVYVRLKNVKKRQKKISNRQTNVNLRGGNILYYVPGMTVAQIADNLKVGVSDVVRKLIMFGYMVSASQAIDRDIVEILADEFKFILKDKANEDITKFENIKIDDPEELLQGRAPIVTIMGHVDHGKTTLLDTIRNSNVVSNEAGGITQHIGAYQVKKNGKSITFIDTPGHAAFTEMRARGAMVTDIVVLIVAADDGVMPQTKEAIDHAKSARVPIIVAVNKIDKPNVNPDRIKQELSKYDLVPEEWGGNTIYVNISALTGQGVDELLEMISLTAEMENYRANPNRLGMGTVIEAKLDRGRGSVATLLVKNGSIKIGDPIVVGNTYGKIRAMQDETRAQIKSAGPSKAVEITGLNGVPQAGDQFMVFEDEKTARLIAEERTQRAFEKEMGVGRPIQLANIFDDIDQTAKELNLIIKGDVHGSIEALQNSLEKLNVEGIKVNVIRSGVGAVTENDINLAVASQAIIVAFNVRPMAQINEYAKEKEIEIRLYNVIYKLLEDIEAALTGMLEPIYEEKILGQAEVREIFKASKLGTIAGCYITDGLINRNADARLIRDSIVVYEGKIASLRRFKDDVKEVKTGYECGITIENFNDIKVGDIIEAYIMEKVKRV
ncbi:MAG: translation initiation factor IF-2 [Bacilli bacterium]|nr:translation initiation factor IF-2 [Bacilli bacterium]MDD4076553.1 translation initiation factor IF-2 [Bacilli bacterium]MDD4387739.1 translation initiation factor IF-2 [Bacilli bacterium]